MTFLQAAKEAEELYFRGVPAKKAFSFALEAFLAENDLDEPEEEEVAPDHDDAYWARYDYLERREEGYGDAANYEAAR